MKKNCLFTLMAMFMMLFAASCSQEEVLSSNNEAGKALTVSVGIPVLNPATRVAPSIPAGYKLRCIMQLVNAQGAIDGERYVEEVPANSESIIFTFTVPEGGYTNALFWADYVKGTDVKTAGDNLYVTTDLTKVSYNTANISELFNNDAADAFYGCMLSGNNSIQLKRPFTKLTFKSTATEYSSYTKIKVTDLPIPTNFNVQTGATSGTATSISSGELTIANNVWFSTYIFTGTSTTTLGEGNDIKFTLSGTSGSTNLVMSGKDIALAENKDVTATITPSQGSTDEEQATVTVTFPENMEKYDPNALAVGDYINKDGSHSKTYSADNSVAIVFALAEGKTDNSSYGTDKTVAGYAVALTSVGSGTAATADAVVTTGITTSTANAALFANGYGIAAWSGIQSAINGGIATKLSTFAESNAISANVSDWYIPTPAMLKDILGMLYNEDGWTTTSGTGMTDVTVDFPAKDSAFYTAYTNGGGSNLAGVADGSAKNMLTSAVTADGKVVAIQLAENNKKLSALTPAKASSSVACCAVITIFAE